MDGGQPEGPSEGTINLADRGMIQTGRLRGMTFAEIGAKIGRNRSVVWREVSGGQAPAVGLNGLRI